MARREQDRRMAKSKEKLIYGLPAEGRNAIRRILRETLPSR
jgi:hypothetical protein